MANDNEVKFTAKIDDQASSAIENLAEKNEELADAAESASKSIEQLESAQANASSAAENAAQANASLSNANADISTSAEDSAQATEDEAQAKDKAAKSAENLAEKQQKAAGGTNILQNALGRLKDGFALDVVIGNLVTKGIDLAISAFKNLGEAVVDCVYKFADAEMISARLEASLRNQGITSAYVTKELNDYAQSMQSVYGVSDDVIKNGMRLLVNFGVIGDELKQATNSAYALSQGLGIDVQSAFQMVARAAEGNVTALSRYGIKVDTSKTQSEQFAQALEQIDNKFGSLAGASANNLITKTNALKESWGDFKEQVGAAFEPLAQIIVNLLTKGVQGLQKAFTFCTDCINILVETGVQGFNYVSLGILKTKEVLQELNLKTLEFRNAIGLASDEAVATARKNLEATQAEIAGKKEQIEIFRQSTQYLASERDAIAANSAESKKAAEEQIAAAKARSEHSPSRVFEILGGNAAVGLANGIYDRGDEAIRAARWLADSVAMTVQSALDIHSPSRVFERLGAFTGLGFAEGIEGSATAVDRAVDRMLGATARRPVMSAGFGAWTEAPASVTALVTTLEMITSSVPPTPAAPPPDKPSAAAVMNSLESAFTVTPPPLMIWALPRTFAAVSPLK